MDAPAADSWSQVADRFRDDDWTDEVQGVAWDGSHWLFSANANQNKPGHDDKALYVFRGGDTLSDGNWKSRIKFTSVPRHGDVKCQRQHAQAGPVTIHGT